MFVYVFSVDGVFRMTLVFKRSMKFSTIAL